MIRELLKSNYTLEDARALQKKYIGLLKNNNLKNVGIKNLSEINWIMGVDISYYSDKNREFGVACAVMWDLQANEMKNHYFAQDLVSFPYKAGFLGFRECNLLARAISKSSQKPDLIICDGHGVIHPIRFGEAVQLGVALNIPTFGVAKNPFIGYSEWTALERIKGNKTPVWSGVNDVDSNQRDEMLGYAACLTDNMKPVFISIGYRISLDLSMELALQLTSRHRQPEPIFLADQLSRARIKNFK